MSTENTEVKVSFSAKGITKEVSISLAPGCNESVLREVSGMVATDFVRFIESVDYITGDK